MARRFPGPCPLFAALAGLTLLAHSAAWAAPAYRFQPIVKRGDPLGDLGTQSSGFFFVGSLNDAGQLALVTNSPTGSQILLQYADGRLTPIAGPDAAALGGTWSGSTAIGRPVSMNDLGDVAFTAAVTAAGRTDVGAFLWRSATRQVTPLVVPGMPAVNGLTFESGGTGGIGSAPAINKGNEIALVAGVKSAGGRARDGLFLFARDGGLQPVALPGEVLPGGERIESVQLPSLNDAGAVALVAEVTASSGGNRRTLPYDRLCLWERGTLTPLTAVDAKALGVLGLLGFTGVWINDQNRDVLLAAHLHDLSGGYSALYRFADGRVVPVAVPGQKMPGGGRFRTLQPQDSFSTQIRPATGVSAANAVGQHVILATLEDESTAAYLMEPDGKLSLILKRGTATSLGKVLSVGLGAGNSQGVALNGKGQVAVTLFLAGGVETVALLTPAAP